MTVRFLPSAPTGTASAPPSKSMAHRLLICAGLAEGGSTVRGVAPSEDILATLDCLNALGAEADAADGTATVQGTAPSRSGPALLRCRESGSTLRFFLPLCLLSGREMTMAGSETLLNRPLYVYEELCAAQGLRFERKNGAIVVEGKMRAGNFVMDGNISSQFVSGLLFALPLLRGDSCIRLRPPVESRSYINMTVSALRAFGVAAGWDGRDELVVPGGQCYLPQSVEVEGDWSNAAFFLALGVPVDGLRGDSLQGDKICVAYFKALEAGRAELDLSDCPDLGPVLFSYAALHHGGSFTGTRRLRIKESDRGAAMAEELKKFGVALRVEENRITVDNTLHPPSGPLYGHNDHRIVMALSVLCARTGGTIEGAEAVRKSFPDFFQQLRRLGIKITISQ